jgi:hypothetical protein
MDFWSTSRTRIVELVIKAHLSKGGEVIESGEIVASFEGMKSSPLK